MSERILDDILEQLQTLNEVQQEMKNDVTDLKNDVKDLKNDVTDLKNDVTGLKNDVTDLKNDVSEIKKQIEDLPAIRVAVLETKEIVERLESTDKSHEQTLTLLSRRSIDQEAELTRMKQLL